MEEKSDWLRVKRKWKHLSIGSKDLMIGISRTNKKNVWIYRGDKWEQLGGELVWADIGEDGDVWGCNKYQDIYRRVGGKWEQQKGCDMVIISVGCAKNVLGVNYKNVIYRWGGVKWAKVDEGFISASIGPDGTIWAIGENGVVYKRNDENNGWDQIAHPSDDVWHVTVGWKNLVYTIDKSGLIYQYIEGSWETRDESKSGKKNTIAVASDGTLVKQLDGEPWIWGQKQLTEDEAKENLPPHEGSVISETRIHIGNLARSITKEKLSATISGCKPFRHFRIEIIKKRTCFGFVTFENAGDATMVLRKLKGARIDRRRIRVSKAFDKKDKRK